MSLVNSMGSEEEEHEVQMEEMEEPELRTMIIQIIHLIGDSQPEPESELVSLVIKIFSLVNAMKSDLRAHSELKSLIPRVFSIIASQDLEPDQSELPSLITRMITILSSMDSNSWSEQESELVSLVTKTTSLVTSMEPESETESELKSLITQIISIVSSDNSKLVSLIGQWEYLLISPVSNTELEHDFLSLTSQTISLVRSMDFESQPKPHSELIALVTQFLSLLSSVSDSDPESELISLITENISCVDDSDSKPELGIIPLISRLAFLKPQRKIISVVRRMVSLVGSMTSDSEPVDQLISVCPQMGVVFEQGRFRVNEFPIRSRGERWICGAGFRQLFSLAGGDDADADATHFWCQNCNGDYHEECDKSPPLVDHFRDQKHLLQLVVARDGQTMECYCCTEDLLWIFYYCASCEIAINITCLEKPPVFYIDCTKWHEHTLTLFPRHGSLTCNLCGLDDARSAIYMCPRCNFVVHQKCLSLPRVIRISRHPHRISFTPSFGQEAPSCYICRKDINRYYGGFCCIKDDCSYTAHSRCATQRNVWDGIELEGVEEEVEEEVLDPFVIISDGIIQHFSHPQHHLRLDENTSREYDENELCHACITPIYFGNIYSCMQCDFILHEECANFRRKIHHPIHPHMLTLGERTDIRDKPRLCSACPWLCTGGLIYECRNKECDFQLHLQCASISEPLVHPSHTHSLFLTSKPEEWQRKCSVCKKSYHCSTNESFNCIEEECDFALCFVCATLPQKVRYKHDKHILTMSYGNETSTTTNWCEGCEEIINPMERFYVCDEYCCVTLHIECLIGADIYMKPDSSFHFHMLPGSSVSLRGSTFIKIWPNRHMCRPFCSICRKRCPHKIIVTGHFELLCCSTFCLSEL
ncbi:PREDICTED: uncharacterized protein LOC104768511 [Camelina sativa]|uniref:Uncharacterized protein LOC104768511 n=1 Tax=Camelina sativa TaxID=90675 RepID=A0ABM0XTH0_CAMSA|nr:PREDICTED: uncharacterized protein LOC104768511 [Camelina sativa]